MMFISKFNAMIRNRIVWGVIAFLVVMAFVVWGTKLDDNKTGGEAEAVGKLDGKPVRAEEFRLAYANSRLSLSLSLGGPLKSTPEVESYLRESAWKRLVSLRAAEAMGLFVSEPEIEDAIRQQSTFMVDGRYSPERYSAFIQGYLGQLGVSRHLFEEFLRQELILRKLQFFLAQTVWITPADVAQIFHQLYDSFTLQYVEFVNEELEHRFSTSEEDAWRLFDENRKSFTRPELVKVKYVLFRNEDYLDNKQVSEETLWRYYDKYLEAASAEADANSEDLPQFEDIKDLLRAAAALDEAEQRASDKAAEFEVSLAPDRTGQAPAFEEAAASLGLTISTTDLFAAEGKIVGVEAGLDFNEAAFSLRSTPEEYFSYPIKGKSGFYVMGLLDRVAPRVPSFEEVREEALQAARSKTISNGIAELAREIRADISSDLAAGMSFKESAASRGLQVFTLEPFTVTAKLADYESLDDSYVFLKYAIDYDSGDLTDVIPVNKGSLLGYVEAREPAPTTAFDSIRSDLLGYMKQRRVEIAFVEWQAYKLASGGFEDNLRSSSRAAEGAEDADREEDVEDEWF